MSEIKKMQADKFVFRNYGISSKKLGKCSFHTYMKCSF